ncbi:GntR family transcriptional regulator [Prosthecomicrobium sp. N25]|uniref:GntR family transcriptional regulator n=1 Tax=Prosthecomicrobium sp. N25 TaxID=3129254 RepID=UPI0030789DB7
MAKSKVTVPDLDEADGLGSGRVYREIRDGIIEGRLPAGARLKASELAERFGTSTNPVREALQRLQGEGFVVISPNRGARVRSVDEDFVRNVYEIIALVEPYLVRWFAETASPADIARLAAIQAEIEVAGFDDQEAYGNRDSAFHGMTYAPHYNSEALALWARQRGILRAISRRFPFTEPRRRAILAEHRALIDAIRSHDPDAAARVVEAHVRGAGLHLTERLRAERLSRRETEPAHRLGATA